MNRFEYIYLIKAAEESLRNYRESLDENEATLKRIYRENSYLRGKINDMSALRDRYVKELNKLDINAQEGENINAKE